MPCLPPPRTRATRLTHTPTSPPMPCVCCDGPARGTKPCFVAVPPSSEPTPVSSASSISSITRIAAGTPSSIVRCSRRLRCWPLLGSPWRRAIRTNCAPPEHGSASTEAVTCGALATGSRPATGSVEVGHVRFSAARSRSLTALLASRGHTPSGRPRAQEPPC